MGDRVRVGVETFFERYARAFDAGSSDALISFFALPCLLHGEAGGGVVASPEDLRGRLERLIARHRRAGYHRASHRVVAVRDLHPRFLNVDVAWLLYRKSGAVLGHFGVTYTLAREEPEATWRVATTVPNRRIVAN